MTEQKYRVVIGSDDAGYQYKQTLIDDLQHDSRVADIIDVGVHEGALKEESYPQVAIAAAEKIASGEADRGVLICGTGIGMAISANKVAGVRAAVGHDSFSVERSILSNDCQVLALGQRVVGVELARRLVKEWLGYVFDPTTPSQAKVDVIRQYESSC